MKRLFLFLFFLIPFISEGQQIYIYPNNDTLKAGVQEAIAPGSAGPGTTAGKDAYLYLPPGYDSSKAMRYPLIFFYHGAGEVGSGGTALSKMLEQGLPGVIQQGHPPYSVNSNGDTTWFIVYSRQMTYQAASYSEPVTAKDYRKLMDYYKLKVDTTRIYATGLSAGGGTVQDIGLRMKWLFAATVPMSGSVELDTTGSTFNNVPISIDSMRNRFMWLIHAYDDPGPAYFWKSSNPTNWINAWFPGHAILSSYTGGHCCWETFYNPTWKWTDSDSTSYDIGTPNNMSIYDWMLQYNLVSEAAIGNGVNIPPTANAGPDQELSAGTTTATLNGSGTDPDGRVVSYHWATTGNATITTPNNAATTVTGLQNGVSYDFILTVVDDSGATAQDQVSITVQSADNGYPTLQLDEDTTLVQPANTYYFNSIKVTPSAGNTFTDNSNTVLWSALSQPVGAAPVWIGPQYQLNGHALGNMNLVGDYVVSLTVTQSNGNSVTKQMTIHIVESPVNEPPNVNPGSNQTITLPTSTVSLNGTASDPDGTISSTTWACTQYPSGATPVIANKNSLTTTASGLTISGIYYFNLAAQDNAGATSSANMTVTVKNPVPTNTSDYKIVIDTGNHINHSGVYNDQVTETGSADSAWVLFDQQKKLDSINSIISSNDNLIYWRSKDTVTIDLGGYYALKQIDLTVNSSSGYLYYQTGTPGNWSAPHLKNASSTNRFVQMNLNGTENSSYIRLYWGSFGSAPRVTEMLLYGHLLSDSLPRINTRPPDTASYKIPISINTKFWSGDTVFYQVNDIKGSGNIDSLFDEQGANPQNGVYTPIPTTGFTSGVSSHSDYPAIAIVDLGGYYSLTDIWGYIGSGTDSLKVCWGEPLNWSAPIAAYINGSGWKDLFSKKIYTRYLKIYWNNSGYQKLYELMVYGHLIRDSLSRTAPSNIYTNQHKLSMGNFMGANIWGGIPFKIIDPIGHTKREYVNQNYIDTSLYQHNIDSIKFVLDKFSAQAPYYSTYYNFPNLTPRDTTLTPNPLQAYLRHAKSVGDTWFFALQGAGSYANNYSYGYDIDKVEHPIRDSVNVNQYDRLSRMGWTIAAMFGDNKYPADSVQVTYPSPDSSGMGIMGYIETGNEMNGTWGTPYQYYSPEMFEAYSSAIYDGNDHTMGGRMGIKTADDSIKVVMAGTAGIHPERLKSFYYYSYYKRPDHKLPVDVINFHSYPGYVEHLSPEQVNPIKFYASIDSVAHETCPGCAIWLTEWGYARNHQSVNAVAYVPGKDSAQVQADWTARFWFLLSMTDISRATYYQIRNEPTQHYLDSTATGTYTSMGLTDGHNGSYYAFPAYYYVHTIFETLGDYKEDSVVHYNQGGDSLYILRYRSIPHPDSVCYVVWSGTETNRTVNSYSIQTGHSLSAARIIYLKDKKMYGDTANVTTNFDGTTPLTITETPQLLFTTEGTNGGNLVQYEPPSGTGLTFYKVLYLYGYVYILWKDNTGKIYYTKLQNQ